MQTHKEGNQHLDDLFKEARQEKPILGLDEVKNIIPASNTVIGSKGFQFSISHIIVVSGIIVSSGLAYFTMKSDKTAADKIKSEQVAQEVSTTTLVKSPNSFHSQIKPQSSKKNNTLLASTDEKLIVPSTKYKKVNLNEENIGSQKLTSTVKLKHDDKQYEITMVGTEVTNIKMEGATVTSEEYAQHSDVIEIARGYAEARIKEEGDKQQLMSIFDKQLRADKIAPEEGKYTFQLTSSSLLIDGVPQDNKAFTRYSKLYKEQAGKEIANGDEYQFKMKRKQLINKEVYGLKVKEN
jgi:hypothetical protein